MGTGTESNLWNRHLRQWNALGPPLRPAAEDITLFNQALLNWNEDRGDTPADAFVLGSTPEFPHLNWNAGSRVYALDSSIDMLRNVWPKSGGFSGGSVVMNWLALPLRERTADMVLGDGAFTLLDWPDGYHRLLMSIADLLRPQGGLLARFFVRPEVGESPEAVIADLIANRMASFHLFKWRLAMAVHGDRKGGLRVDEIWKIWEGTGIQERDLADITGWSVDIIRTIHAYRDSTQILSFPSAAALRSMLGEVFTEMSCRFPAYDIGDCCPIICLQSRG